MDMNAIEMSHVSKTYGSFAIEDMNLVLPEGCIMGLVGENGAGKSTTIGLIMHAIAGEGGSIKVLGVDNTSKEFLDIREDVGIVLDEAYFPEVLNAKDVNKIMKHTYKKWREDTFFRYIERFSIETKKKFKDYSRGMKMKLAIAVALSHNARLLILDEATSGLDPVIRDEILDIFNEFTREENHSVLISSHIISDLEKICDYVAFLHKGKLVLNEEKDRLQEIYGMIHTGKKEAEDIPKEAVVGMRDNGYSKEILVKRELVPGGFDIERAGIEDIILYLAKEGKQ